MRRAIAILAAAATFVGAQSTTSIDIDAISVAIPTSVFVLPVIYVTEEGAPIVTATTLASTATASSDAAATVVFDSEADVSAAISSASVAAATSTVDVAKRDATCVAQPSGISYNSNPDTASAFAADSYYPSQAAAAATPSGYVQTFEGLTASNSADNYLGFTLLSSYDVQSCVNKCTAISGCNSINIYFERDPTVNPDDASCSNPPSTINIKCVFWGGAVTSANANNFGQYREDFQVVIAGSNGYVNSTYAASLVAAAKASSTSSSAASYATDSAGTVYTIYYSSDSTQGSYSNVAASSSYKDCMTACDADSSCDAFTYVGGTNGVGSGTCWLKTALGSPSPSGTNVVSGSKSSNAVSSKVASTSASTTSSSSSSSSISSTSSTSTSTVSSTSSTSSSSSSKTSSTSSTSTASSTSSTSSTSSSSSNTSSTSSSSSTSTSSSTSSSSKTSSSSTVSSTSSSTSSSTTTTSTVTKSSSTTSTSTTSSTTATTLSTVTKSSSTTSSSSTSTTSTTTSASATTTPFYIQIEGSGTSADDKYVSVANGNSASASFVSSINSATKFVIDNTSGYLLEYNGAGAGYAANLASSASLQKLLFSKQTQSVYGFAKCSLNTEAGWIECSVQSQAEAAVVCPSDSYQSLQFMPTTSTSSCNWVALMYIPV